jgi:hypothetical protein
VRNRKELLTVNSTIQPRPAANLCFWGAATAVMPLPLPVTPTAKNRVVRDATKNPILPREPKHTFTQRVIWRLEDARTRNAGDVNTLLFALLRELLPGRLLLVLLLGLLCPDFQFLLVLLFLPLPLLFLCLSSAFVCCWLRTGRVVHRLVVPRKGLYRGGVDELGGVVAFEYDGVDPIIDRSADRRDPSRIPLAIG